MSKFNADSITPTNWAPVHAVRRKLPDLYAVQLNLPEGFEYHNATGELEIGNCGDYLVLFADGTKESLTPQDFDRNFELLRTEFVLPTESPKVPEYIEPPQQQQQRPRTGAQVGNVVSTGLKDLFKGTSWGN